MNGQWLEPILAVLGLVLITLVTRAFFMLPERDLPLPDWLRRGLSTLRWRHWPPSSRPSW